MLHRTAWFVMTLLALGVAGYGSMALWNPDAIDFIANRNGALRYSLIAHGAVSAIALAIGPFQFIEALRQKRPLWHRISGRIYLVSILVGGLTGLWLSFYTSGGLPGHTGFFTLAILWLLSGVFAYQAALRRDFTAHRAWMMRSYALTFAAVTLRLYLGLGVSVAGFPFDQVYATVAWASWTLNLVVVEWLLIQKEATKSLKLKQWHPDNKSSIG